MSKKRESLPVMSRAQGTSMIEVLVTIVIITIGLLGLAAMQMKTQMVEMESYQRSQAMVILNDMVNKFQTSRDAAYAVPDTYINAGVIGGGAVEDCSALTGEKLDLCEWGNALRGAGETSVDGTSVGAMIGARGCITQIQAQNTAACLPGVYEITVTWQGMFATVAPNNTCMKDDALYGGNDAMRRAISLRVSAGTGSCIL